VRTTDREATAASTEWCNLPPMRARLALFVSAIFVVSGCGDNLNGPGDGNHGPQCHDNIDNDGDGKIDFPDDPGCESITDDSEDSPAQPQCMDHRDNDDDGKTDYPDDPGCLSPNQDSEIDTCPGAGCPQCADGIDNDGNGKIDYPEDPGCTSASDNDEFQHDPLACGMNVMIKQLPSTLMESGVLAIASKAALANACGNDGTTEVPAVVYELHLTANTVVVVATDNSGVDTIVDIRKAPCTDGGSSIACNDNISTTNAGSQVTAALQAGNYYIVVETHSPAQVGTYMITVELFAGEGTACADTSECGPGLICRIKPPNTTMTCEKHVCSDGVDDDGDGLDDYPLDPGCESPTDDDETDDCPNGPNCPACSDHIDNDSDGQTDYPADTSCSSAGGSSESCSGEQDPVGTISTTMTTGTLVGAHDDHNASCVGTDNVDVLYTMRVTATSQLIIDTDPSVADTVLSLLPATCAEPSLYCDDDGGATGHASKITATNLPGGNYVVAVDTYNTTAPDTFVINVHGTIAVGASCEPNVTLNGALTCPTTNPCTGAVGSRICRFSQCGDGIDNDGDGKIDFPAEPGCSSALDDDESDTCPGAGCPQCADGVDNDSDGHIDYPADLNCASASGTSELCLSSEPIALISAAATAGTTVGATNDYNPACASSLGSGPDVTYEIDVPKMDSLDLNLTTSYDTVHELLNASCQGAALACSDPTTMHLTNLLAGSYFLVVDGYSSTSSGTFTVNVSGNIAVGGSCEGPLATAGVISCSPGTSCVGTPGTRTCQGSACNDGVDNDTDGKIDYPNDPGCDSIDDTDEADTCPGVGCPVCSDTTDNDTDGHIDYATDLSCWAASGNNEAFCNGVETDRAQAITRGTTTGTTVGMHTDIATETCQSNATGNDIALSLQLPVPVTTIQFDTVDAGTTFDTILSLRDTTCAAATQIGCNDDTSTPFSTRSTLVVTALAAGNYALVLDGYSGQSGSFTLHTHGLVANGTDCTSPLFTNGALACTSPATCIAGTCQ